MWDAVYTIDIPATCEKEGSESIHCTKCDSIREDSVRTIPKKDHSYGKWRKIKAATEIAKGKKTHSCSDCGYVETKSIARLTPTLKRVKILAPRTANRSVTFRWKRISSKNLKKTKKIQIQYSTDKAFKKGIRTKYVSARKISCKITRIKEGRKYYVRLRAYTKKNGKVHVSKWSKNRSVIIKWRNKDQI